MTVGSKTSRASRNFAAPRRRFRSEDDAGYLGDAPILLNLPSLCGVPDVDEQTSGKTTSASAQSADGVEPASEDGEPRSTLAEPEFYTSLADRSTDAAEETDGSDEDELARGRDAPQDDDSHAEPSFESEDADFDEMPSRISGPRNLAHRKIITWTAIFVAAASLYMYANRDRPEQAEAPLPAVDVDMGWESIDAFGPTEDDGGPAAAPVVEFGLDPLAPAAASPAADDPRMDPRMAPPMAQSPPPLEPAPPVAPLTPAPALDQPVPLPALTDATGGNEMQFQRLRPRGEDLYPTTSTPEAAYRVSERTAPALDGARAP